MRRERGGESEGRKKGGEVREVNLVNDRLHVTLVLVIAIEQSGPLLRADPQPCLHGHADNLTVMLTAQALVGAELNQSE